MQRLTFIFVIAFFLMTAGILAVAHGDTMHPANQRTIAWDPAENATAYVVYAREAAGPEAIYLGETDQTHFTATLETEGVFRLGVRSIRREPVNGVLTTVAESDIAWSDDPLACLDGETFGIYYFLSPPMAANLRAQ